MAYIKPKQQTWVAQGPLFMGDYDPINGTVAMGYLINLRRIGDRNVKFTTTPKLSTGKQHESSSGRRLTAKKYVKEQALEIALTMGEFDRDMLATEFHAVSTAIVAGTVTGEILPPLANGDFFFLKYPKASNLVLVDSTPTTPVSLVLNTNYLATAADLVHGRGQLINIATLTQPIKASYSYDAQASIAGMTKTLIEKGIFGTFTNDEGDSARVAIPRFSMESGAYDWLSTDPSPITLTGEALYASELDNGTDWGGFIKIDGLTQ
ncbi:MAG: phage tail tube protein [Halothiobacillus sp.]